MKKLSNTIYEPLLHKQTHDKERITVRAVIFKEEKVLMLYSKMFNDYTFPGGGVKEGDLKETLKRELREEIGALKIEVIRYIGYIEEMRYGIRGSDHIYKQTSHYYECTLLEQGSPSFVEREKHQGLESRYVTIEEAILHNEQVMKDEQHQKKGLKTVLSRENTILRYLKGEKHA